jgi:hypothetical protein
LTHVKDGFKVFDANRHVIEPAEVWQRLDGPSGTGVSVGAEGAISVLGRPVSRPRLDFLAQPAYRECFQAAMSAGFSAEATLSDMDREGVDAALLFPTAGMFVPWADHVDRETAASLCRAYNLWLKDYCAADPGRLKGVALLPLQSIDVAVAELRRAVEADGHVAFVMRPNPLLGRFLHDPAYDRLYEAAEALGVPVIVKELMGSVLPTIGADRFPGPTYQAKAVAEPFELMLAFLSFFGANLAERFPRLQVGFAGAGAGWLPYWLERHEEHWGAIPFGTDCPSTLPADWLFERQGFVVADPWETSAPDVMEHGRVLWGSHYPLPEAVTTFPAGPAAITGDRRLADDAKTRLLWEDAAKLFRLDG